MMPAPDSVQSAVKGDTSEMSRFFVGFVLLGALFACGRGDAQGVSCDRDGVTLESGLQVRDLSCGDGAVAARGHSATVEYEARLQNGDVFDRSDDPMTFRLGVGQVVPGWDEGVVGMRVGGTRQLVVPPDLAYGGTGLPPDVPPDATVVFEVELLRLVEPER